MEDSYSHYHAGISSSEQTKVPRDFNAVGGKEALFGGKEKEEKLANRGQIVFFAEDGDKVSIRNPINADSPMASRRFTLESLSN